MKSPEAIKLALVCGSGTPVRCKECSYLNVTDRACNTEADADALDYIKQLEAKVPKWISVKESLPEEGKFVLLQYEKNAQNPTLHARNTMAVGRYEYGMFLVEGCSVRVTHWMPLPEPPEV